MISDFKTNKIYFSGLLQKQFPHLYRSIEEVLSKLGIEPELLPWTKDIWVRDFMPLQVSINKFIEYRYDPDYLQAKRWRSIKSYPDMICEAIGLKTIKSDITVDGGNIVKSENSVIMTDKVLEENKEFYSREQLIDKLCELFEVPKIVLIPWDKERDYTGHADAMLRFINEKTLVLPAFYSEYEPHFRDRLFEALCENGLSWEELCFDEDTEDEQSWAYLNFLQTRDVIIVPLTGNSKSDEQALRQIRAYYPAYSEDRVIGIDMKKLIANHGALNCVSWTVLA